MNQFIAKFGPIVGRSLIALVFLVAGVGKITGFAGTVATIASKGLPMAQLLAAVSIIVEVVCALMVVVGWRAKLAATVIFLWLIPVTLIFHPFWSDPSQLIMFLKNLSIMGAILYVMVYGSGPLSVDKD